jgi:hypothetical protein
MPSRYPDDKHHQNLHKSPDSTPSRRVLCCRYIDAMMGMVVRMGQIQEYER